MTNVKKILAILLALCIVCGGTSVLAAGQTVTYTSPTSRYQAQKFSHPDAGVGEIDGIIEYDSGENDRGQNYSWSAQGYGDYMYVGTCYAAIYATINIMAKQSGVDVEVFKAGLNALYNGTLYMGDLENNPSDARRSILVRVNVRTGEVKLVAEPKNMGGYRASITYNGKLYVGTFDIGSLAYPLMQVTNGDILKRSPEEWKTQFEYIIKLLELLKSSGSLAARSATGISSMSATLTSMTSLLNQGGIEDLASTEAFYSLLKKVVSLYENLRKYLPDSITEKLDGIFNQDTVDNFYYFIGVCKYLSKGERGFDLLVSGDGINFDAITRNGFGDPYNHGCRVFAITDAGLCLGTANPFYGTQLWRLEDLAEDSQNPAGDETEQVPSQPEAANPNAPDSSDQTQADTEQADATQKPDLAGQQDETEQGTQPEQNEGTGASADEPDIPATSESTAGIALALTAVMAGGVLVLLHRRKAK